MKNRTMQEMNEQYKSSKSEKHEYQVGDRDINEVLYRNAFERAFSEVMEMHRHGQIAE